MGSLPYDIEQILKAVESQVVDYVGSSFSILLPATTITTQDITPPEGEIWFITAMTYYSSVNGGTETTGNLYYDIKYGLAIIKHYASYGATMEFRGGHPITNGTADTTQELPSVLVLDAEHPLVFQLNNQTDNSSRNFVCSVRGWKVVVK